MTAIKGLTKGWPITPGNIIGYINVFWLNDVGAVSVQFTLSVREERGKKPIEMTKTVVDTSKWRAKDFKKIIFYRCINV